MVRMNYYTPELAFGHLPPQRKLQDKFGGLPWGIPQERWPRCQQCGNPMAHVMQMEHDTDRLDLGGDRVLCVFMCFNFDDCSCETWDAESEANAVLIVERNDLTATLCVPDFDNLLLYPEVRVLKWNKHEDPVTPELFPLCFDDAYFDLPDEVGQGIRRGTKLGGAPAWLQGAGEGPASPYRFAGQFSMEHHLPPPAPKPITHEAPAVEVFEGLDNVTWKYSGDITAVSNDGSFLCQAADYGDSGTAYLFVNPDPSNPSGKFFWQC